MTARLIDGKELAESVLSAVRERVMRLVRPPLLVAVAVSDDKASRAYTKRQAKIAAATGIEYRLDQLPDGATEADLRKHLASLNADAAVTGVILQTPLPKSFAIGACRDTIVVEKDVEGVTTPAAGLLATGRPAARPCTAAAAVHCLIAALGGEKSALRGLEIAVVGRSDIVGKPLALLLVQADATVTICHRGTKDLGAVLRRMDAVIAAAGAAALVRGDMLKPGAIVIDVGTNPVETAEGTKIVGDVDFASACEVASAITPVPGGVGQVTTALLMRNVVDLAEASNATRR